MFAEQLHADRPQSFAERGGSSPPVPRDTLLARYNLELARGMLRDAVRVELQARGGWRDVFRAVNAAGLMHELVRSGKRYRLLRTGPAATFLVRPSRYGVRFARVLPVLARALGWRVRAELVRDFRASSWATYLSWLLPRERSPL